jgi:hypothetical protein
MGTLFFVLKNRSAVSYVFLFWVILRGLKVRAGSFCIRDIGLTLVFTVFIRNVGRGIHKNVGTMSQGQ